MYHLRTFKSILLLLLITVTAKAQLSDGKVYNFVCVGKGASMSITSMGGVNVTNTNQSSYAQLWYAVSENGGYTLRNLGNGRYLQSPNSTSSAWTTVKEKDANCVFSLTSVGSNYAIRVTGNTGGYNFMHADGGNNVVCWENSNPNTQWTIQMVNISSVDLNDNWNKLESIDPSAATTAAYQTALDNLFTDKACTTLKKSFASESAVKNDADYKSLPVALQNMVLKVYKNNWSENNLDNTKAAWDNNYAKKYRVQFYEPYNNVSAAAEALGLNAHTNLNNPTGIFANSQESVYVMVQGTIKDGASLYLTSYTGHGKPGNDHTEGIRLTEGLNIVPSFVDGNNYIINYVVETFDISNGKRGNKAKARKLSDYAPLKIHFEGGYINGYYNKVGDALYTPDKNADWEYIEARATQTDVTVLGKYITLQFPLNDDHTEGNKGLRNFFNNLVSVEDCIDEWDNVMLWERLVLGVLDETTTKAEAKTSPYSSKDVFEYTGNDADGYNSGYGDYYNVHGLSFGVGGDAYMYGGWDHCGYHYGTMGGVIMDLPTNAGSHWGPGHEIGHQHQKLLTVNGLTEVTNNLFANVVLWYFGETTSRYNGTEGSLSHVLEAYNTEGSDFFTNNIWALTHMYYKLFLYYHVLGHNTKFYPKLFEMLRQDPMSTGYEQNGTNTLLHFYKKCCDASGDDLTEFFRAHGFFRVMDNRLVGDYSNSVYTTTQADIDAAIASVKAKKYEENIAVLFINDATGETIKSHKGDNLTLYGETTVCAEVGSYASFEANTKPNYTYSVSGTTVTMEGTGGTGFAIFNEKGEIISFSDKKKFEISSECAAAIAAGKATIKAVQADNTIVEMVDVMSTDNSGAKYTALGELLSATQTILALKDDTGKKVGFYRATSLTNLQTAYMAAKTVYDDQTTTSYSAVYDALFQEYTAVQSDGYAQIGIVPQNTYRLTNKAYPGRSMAVNTSNNQMVGIATVDTDEQKWYFEESDTRGRYYLKNKRTNLYPGNVATSAVLGVDKSESTKGAQNGAFAYELRGMGNGLWALVGADALHCASSQSYNIVGWGVDADATLWYITAVDIDDSGETSNRLQGLIKKTELLMAEVGEVTKVSSKLNLSKSNYYTNAPCKETAYGDQFTSYDVLCDNNPATFLHTDYSSQAPSEDHYIRIDLGSGQEEKLFNLHYRTRKDGNLCAPTSVVIEASNDNSKWVILREITSGLPTTGNTEYSFADLGNGNAYRYIRMRVLNTSTGQKANDHYYFIVSELGLSKISFVEKLDATYSSMSPGTLLAAYEACLAAQSVLDAGNTAAYANACTALEEKYNALLIAKKNVENSTLNEQKTLLQTLIDKTTALVNSCALVSESPASDLTLSATNGDGVYYLTGGPAASSEGSIDNLLDNDVETQYTSNWGAQTEHPYLQVTLPNGKELSRFAFTFTSRNSGNGPTPTTIVVSGSNNGSDFTLIREFTKANDGFPEAANNVSNKAVKWTSPEIVAATAYKYLRFTVTKSERASGGETDTNGFYHFGISEFGLQTSSGYIVTLLPEAGNASEDLVLATYVQNLDAQAVHTYATTIPQVEEAIAKLQDLYNQLYEAQQAIRIVTYTIQITGGKGNGGVKYGGTEYVNGTTFRAPQGSFTTNDLTAIVPDGYTLKNMDVDHSTGVINVAFSAIPLVDTSKYYTFECLSEYAHSTERFIRDNGAVINGRSAEGSLFQFEAADDDNGYYIKSYVSDKYLNHTDGCIYASAEKLTVWTMAVPSHTPSARTLTVGGDLYLNNNGSDCNDGSCINLQSNSHPGGPGAANACSLWTLEEGTPLDKSALKALIDETNTLIASCYTGDNFNYAGSLNITEALVDVTRDEVTAAQGKYDSKATTASEYAAALAALQIAKDNLQNAISSKDLPVQMTLDVNNPVVYKISINRAGAPVLQYDPTSMMVAVNATTVAGDKSQGWYFKAADNGKVYIMPYYDKNTTLALGTNDFSEGNSKVEAVAVDTDGYTQEWTITANANKSGWYNITCTSNGTDTWYFSNHGGVNYKMGFYNVADDDGSLFKFEQVSFDKSEAYYKLYNYYTNETKFATGNITGRNAAGYYSSSVATAYNTAYNNATSVLGSSIATDSDYTNAYNALKSANEALVVNMPEEGKFYRLRSVSRGSAEYAYVKPEENKIYHAAKDSKDATAVWSFTGTTNGAYQLTNLHTGTSLADNGWEYYKPLAMYDEAGEVTIVSLSGDGQVGIKCGSIMLHADGNGKVVHWETGANDGSAWRLEEVDMSTIQHSLTISQYRHAGLYLNYATAIPEGVQVYIAHTPNGQEGTIIADELEGNVLPARTAVIVKGNAGSYNFKYTIDESSDDFSKNLLGGSAYLKYQEVEEPGNLCCVFGRRDNEVGLYKNYVEYKDASGAQPAEMNDTDNGTHFKITANKVYYEYKPSNVAGAAAFRFRFNSRGEQSTAIDDVASDEVYVIYNLYGQRVIKVVEPGIYIINGKKTYVSDSMIGNNE